MKKFMMICALSLSAAAFVHAQETPAPPPVAKVYSPEDMAKRSAKQLAEKLKLSEDQKTKVTALYLEQNTQTAKINEEAGTDRNAARVKVMKLRAEVEGKVVALLTDEQKAAFKAWQDERKAAQQNRSAEKPATN